MNCLLVVFILQTASKAYTLYRTQLFKVTAIIGKVHFAQNVYSQRMSLSEHRYTDSEGMKLLR